VESLPPCAGDGVAELGAGVAAATGSDRALVDAELERVVALGALVPEAVQGGVRWRWAES
jgi:hypothetical protein